MKPASIWIKYGTDAPTHIEMMYRKRSKYSNFFHTQAEAIAFLLNKNADKLQRARNNFKYEQEVCAKQLDDILIIRNKFIPLS